MPKPGRFAPVAVAALLYAPACLADWKFSPAVDLSETYSDNVMLAPSNLARGQFVTQVAPGFSLNEHTPRLTVNLGYRLNLYGFSGDMVGSETHAQSQLQANAKAALVNELLYLDGNASVSQQSASAFGPQINGNGYSAANRNEVRTYSLSPYVKRRFGPEADLELRYRHDLVGSNNPGLGRSQADSLFGGLSSGTGFQRLGWALQVSRQNLHDSIAGDSDTESANASLTYVLRPRLRLTSGVGYDKYQYQGLGGANQGKSWSVGFNWEASPRSSLQASVGRRYFGANNAFTALHRSRNTVWTINYNEAVTTTRSQFLIPATLDTFSLLNRLFAASIPDPTVRAAAVNNYILANGLPAALQDSVNYFSNRYILQKQLQMSAAFSLPHSMIFLSAYDSRRTALTTDLADSELLGSNETALNDHTRQKGLSAVWNWRQSTRFGATLTGVYGTVCSLETGLTSVNRSLRLGFNRQLQRRISGTVELRRSQGSSAPGAAPYTENAVAATLNVKL